MRRQRFGVIGCGNIACKAFLPALREASCADLVVVGSRSEERARHLAGKFDCEAGVGYEAVIVRDDVDVVYIATPVALHAEWAIAAARAGKHVLCEKSLASDLAETRRILDACEQHEVALLEGFMYQFHPQHAAVREAVEQGQIGEPVVFQAWFGFPPLPQDDIRYRPELGGGALLDAGSYTVHSARRFFGREPVQAHSVLSHNGSEVDVHGSALLDFRDGQTAQLSFGFNNMYRNSYMIWGTRGTITLTRAYSIPPSLAATMVVERQGLREERTLAPNNQFIGEIEAFCNGLDDPDRHRLWRDDVLQQSQVLDAIREAASSS